MLELLFEILFDVLSGTVALVIRICIMLPFAIIGWVVECIRDPSDETDTTF